MLLQLDLVGRSLRASASLDLATAILASGVVPGSAIDMEALAYRDRALFVGLKAPQTAAGEALLLRISDFQAALRVGAIDPQRVTRFAALPLHVAAQSGTVAQGISDMAFLPDGSLVLLANSPKGMPPDGGGALWWVRSGGAPKLLRRFAGYKPEGITLTPDGAALMIVFDRDREQPAWLREPLPPGPPTAPRAAPHPTKSAPR